MANRIGRLELLFWYGVSVLGAGIMLVIVATLTGATVGPYLHLLAQAFIIAASILALKAVFSRLHDIGWPGWALIIMFVPFVNALALLFLVIVPGQKKANVYGEPTVFLQRLRKVGSSRVPD